MAQFQKYALEWLWAPVYLFNIDPDPKGMILRRQKESF